MSAATSSRETGRKDADLIAYKQGPVKIYKGAGVSLRADGYAYPARSGTSTDQFIGIANETVDNTAGAAGDKYIRVQRNGTHKVAKPVAVQTDLRAKFYWADDSTLTATATNNQLAGVAVEVVDGATLRIDIAPGVNA